MKFTAIGKTSTIAAFIALTLCAAPSAFAARPLACSVATLKGTFSDKDTGYITSPAAFAGPFAGVNLYTFDGNGGMKSTGVSSINGNIMPVTFQGTYTANTDCTGSYTGQNSLGLTITAYFVITDGGNQIDILVTGPGTVITCVARRQTPVDNQ